MLFREIRKSRCFRKFFALLVVVTSTLTVISLCTNILPWQRGKASSGIVPLVVRERSRLEELAPHSSALLGTQHHDASPDSTPRTERSRRNENDSGGVNGFFFPNPQEEAWLFRPWDSIDPLSPFWQIVDDDLGMLTYSAHYDDVNQPPIIRVVGVARYPLPYSNATCRYYGCLRCPVMASVSGSVVHFRGYNNFSKYIGAFVVCPLPPKKDPLMPFAVSIHVARQTAGSRPFLVHYSKSSHSRQSWRVQSLLQRQGISLEEDDVDVFARLWGQVRRHEDSEGFLNDPQTAKVKPRFKPRETTSARTQQTETKKKPGQTFNSFTTETDGSAVISEKPGYRWNVTRCFPAFHGQYDDHVLLAEMAAVSRALGVDHFVFYVESVGPRVNATLHVLRSLGLAEVLIWNLHVSGREVFYHGQFSAIQDCLYRHLRGSRYVLMADVDEVFMPQDLHMPLPLLQLLHRAFRQHPNCGSFLFRNSFFNLRLPPEPPSPTSDQHHQNTTNTTVNTTNTALYSLAQQRGLPMYLHTLRQDHIFPPAYRSKPALDPRRVQAGSVHVVETLRSGFKSCVMRPEGGVLNHYKRLVDVTSPVMKDDRVRRLGDSYLRDAMDILRQVEDRIGGLK